MISYEETGRVLLLSVIAGLVIPPVDIPTSSSDSPSSSLSFVIVAFFINDFFLCFTLCYSSLLIYSLISSTLRGASLDPIGLFSRRLISRKLSLLQSPYFNNFAFACAFFPYFSAYFWKSTPYSISLSCCRFD